MKQNRLYIYIIYTWLLLSSFFFIDLIRPVVTAFYTSPAIFTIVLVSTLFVVYFWLNGMKDVIYTLYYYWNKPKLRAPYKVYPTTPLVELLYCTCDDFNAASLEKCIEQDYPNYRVVILDDSKNAANKAKIDAFAQEHGIKVVRRRDRVGYKAGNLNHYLKKSKAPFFVILDSDEIIPRDFIQKALPYFKNKNIAILQANHVAHNSTNKFMGRFSDGVESHWNVYQSIKNNYGFLSFLGHGAMIRKSAYNEVGGFPYLVAEDLCFSIELRNKGYYVRFAPEIICYEEYPVSYSAFKKRHAKWTMGNMEFIKEYTGKIFTSKMSWFEKLDIFLFTYNLPLSVVFISYLIINIIVLPMMQFNLNYSLQMLIPTIMLLIAPMLNDIIFMRGKKSKRSLSLYLFSSFLLYGSMFLISFKSALKALTGKAVFIVTPKNNQKIGLQSAVLFNKEEIIFALVLFAVSLFFLNSITSVLLIAIPSLSSVYLTMLSNKKPQLY